MRREAQQRQEVCRYPKYRPCCCERRQLWAAPTFRRCGDSGRNCRHGRSRTSLHRALSPAARAESAPRIGTFFEYRRAAKRETIDLCHWRGHPTPPLCSSGARLTWLCGNHNHSSSTQCGCVAVADWRYRSGGYGKGGIPGFSAFQNWASRIHSNVRFKSSVECARAVMRLYASSKQCWRPQSSFRWRSFPMPAG